MNSKTILSYIKFFFIIIILSAIIITGFLFTVLERPTYSESEKRQLAEKPEFSFSALLDGSYFTALSEYYKDTVPMRESIKELGNTVLNMKGIAKDGIYIYKGAETGEDIVIEDPFTPIPVIEETASPEPTQTPHDDTTQDPTVVESSTPTFVPTATPTATPAPDEDEFDVDSSSDTIIYKNRGMEIYYGVQSSMDKYVNALKNLTEKMPELNVYNMTVPISSAFYMPSKYSSNMTNQKKNIQYIASSLDSKIINIDVYSVLQSHVNEEIYLKTDHHWSHLGCYYGMKAFAEAAGIPYLDISQYQEKTREGYLGTFYYIYKMTQLKNHPETFHYYVSPVTHTTEYYKEQTMTKVNLGTNTLYVESLSTSYSYCICGYFDEYFSKTTTNAGTGRKLAIVKDSFGDPAPQFLLSGFDEIYLIDIRYFQLDIYDYFREQGVTDVLCISCSSTQAGSYSKFYERLFY